LLALIDRPVILSPVEERDQAKALAVVNSLSSLKLGFRGRGGNCLETF